MRNLQKRNHDLFLKPDRIKKIIFLLKRQNQNKAISDIFTYLYVKTPYLEIIIFLQLKYKSSFLKFIVIKNQIIIVFNNYYKN
jgi:hypothetical protein